MYNLDISLRENKYCYVHKILSFSASQMDICSYCGCRSKKNIVKDIVKDMDHLLIEGAQKHPDFMHCADFVSATFVVSKRVFDVMLKEKITGYDMAKKVSLYRSIDGQLVKQEPEYYMINITGIIDLDLKAMHLKKKNVCPNCGSFKWSRQRLYLFDSVFDKGTWDGSDICRIKSFQGYIMISDRLKEIFETHKFTGASFKNENEIFK